MDNGHVTGIPGLTAAVPVANTAGAFPGSRERSTTIITFLYFRPGTPIAAQAAGGQAFARRYVSAPASHLVGVTGPAPAQDAQSNLILRYLPWVELATLAAIALIVGLYFRSPGAPLATLGCVAVAYLVAVRMVALVARRTGAALPPDIEPAPIAGLALAAGFGLLALVPLAQFRQIAVAMVLGILLDTFVVRSLLVPALVVLFGRAGSWPGRTVRPVRRPVASPAAEHLHGAVTHQD